MGVVRLNIFISLLCHHQQQIRAMAANAASLQRRVNIQPESERCSAREERERERERERDSDGCIRLI